MPFYQTIIVADREERFSKHNGQKYALLTVITSDRIKGRGKSGEAVTLKVQPREAYLIGFEESNSLRSQGQHDNEWQMEIGDEVPGDIIARFVQEYIVYEPSGGIRIANTATLVVLGRSDEPTWDERVSQAFSKHGYIFANPDVRQAPAGFEAREVDESDSDNDWPF